MIHSQISKEQQTSPQLSMITARAKLKGVSDKIYETRNRLNILNNKTSRLEYQSLEKSALSGSKEEVRTIAEQRKKATEEEFTRRSIEISHFHSQNVSQKKKHQDRLTAIKNMIQTQNKWVYEVIKQEKEKNLKLIDEERMKERSIKRRNRDQMADSELKRSEYLKEYLKNKELRIKHEKSEEVERIGEQIKEKQRVLSKLEKKSSDSRLNPELSSGVKFQKSSKSDLSKDLTADAKNEIS